MHWRAKNAVKRDSPGEWARASADGKKSATPSSGDLEGSPASGKQVGLGLEEPSNSLQKEAASRLSTEEGAGP